MWLLPAFSQISRAGARIYYRLGQAGSQVPPTGPVLLVANHPNSLLDPALVAAAARRPVRFLAGSQTVAHPRIGWLIRAVGSIPVYRRMDDPSQLWRNEDTFRAATAALEEGSAIGIFPEGVSHDDPQIAPLKTGAARLALSAFPRTGAFPVLPVGLVYRDKERFRSEALVVVGNPIPWDDLAPAGVADTAAVRELTRRIESALRDVTVNLHRWEDAPIVECAEAIYAAELGASPDPAHRVARLREATDALARLREERSERWHELVRDVSRHARLLERLGLQPADLSASPTARDAMGWTARRLPFLALAATGLSALGAALFWLPYRLSGAIGSATAPRSSALSTHTILYGAAVFALWIVLLAVLAGLVGGLALGLIALLVLPVWALATLGMRERWRESWTDARRFFALRKYRERVRELKAEQRALAERLAAVVPRSATGTGSTRFDPVQSVESGQPFAPRPGSHHERG